ncbi:MAG: M15 family metallopeptidase [Clostridiales bacterium]|nr:M15 family metallopeptidase [Clostridium sp. N3C]NLZ48386.1 M15 family metallopeptidase [Clostridiales bacterium]
MEIRAVFKAEDKDYVKTMKQDLLCLKMAYPEYIVGIEVKEDGKVYIVMKSGKKIIYDDKKQKSQEEKIANPDLQDMLEQIYPLTTTRKLMDKNFDPGRGRVYELMGEVYGSNEANIKKNLTNVAIGGRYCQFNKNNKAAEFLSAAIKEINELIKNNKQIAAFVYPTSGTFNFRRIAGTNRLSAHSYGIAIDLAGSKWDYWKWATAEQGQKRLSTYPKELVEVFEKNNFVWGGKWGHFDILHFEYRPEIILKAKYFGGKEKDNEKWYYGAPEEDERIKEYIKYIDDTLK